VTPLFLFRLFLDIAALGLMLTALAYDLLGNIAHEIIGTGLFLLISAHNVFNRRWYGTIPRARQARGLINTTMILALLTAMLALLVTSLMISRSLFIFLPLSGGFSAGQIHTLAAYWALVFVSIHLGMRWSMIMAVTRTIFRIYTPSTARAAFLRMVAVAIAAYGVHSLVAMDMGSKLTARITMNFWDFGQSTWGFFVHCGSIVGLWVFLTHYLAKWVLRRTASRHGASVPLSPDRPCRDGSIEPVRSSRSHTL